MLGVVDVWKWYIWDRFTKELAERLPSLFDVKNQQFFTGAQLWDRFLPLTVEKFEIFLGEIAVEVLGIVSPCALNHFGVASQ